MYCNYSYKEFMDDIQLQAKRSVEVDKGFF